MHNPIAPIIVEKFPLLLRTDYKKLNRFLADFYSFLETQGNPLDVLERFYENSEANRQADQYIQKIVNELGFSTDHPISIPYKELVHHLRDFYLSRGSYNSFNFLFKVLYGTEIDIYYPRTRLFTPSNSTYSSRYFIFTSSRSTGTKEYYAILEQSREFNVRVEGVASQEVAYVEEISQVYSKGVEYLKIQIDSKSKGFRPGEGIRIISEEANVTIIETIKPVLGFTIENPGKGYAVNDRIVVGSSNPNQPAIQGLARIGGIQEGGVDNIAIVSGGDGYSYGESILPEVMKRGNSFSAMISGVTSSNSYLSVPAIANLQLEDKVFTLELWVRRKRNIVEECIIGNQIDGSTNGWSLLIKSNDVICFQYSPTSYVSSSAKIMPNQWYHVAIVRDSAGVTQLFVNGIFQGQAVLSNNTLSSQPIIIGRWKGTAGAFNGFINDLRVTTGVARYTSSGFKPSRYLIDINDDTHKNNVSLLLQSQGSNGSTVFTDSSITSPNTITAFGSVIVSNKESICGTTSCEFRGLGSINAITILNHGMDYAELPLLSIQSTGTGADLDVSSTTIGRVEWIDSIEPYVDFDETLINVSIQSQNGSGAVIRPNMYVIFIEMPTLKTYDGVLGINSTLLDSLYYQQFSYSIISEISRKEYDPFVDLWCHPAGFIRFATLLIQSHSVYPELVDSFYMTKINVLYELSAASLVILQELTYPEIISHMTTRVTDLLVNPLSGLEWFKHSDPRPGEENESNYGHIIEFWDDFTSGDPPLGTTDPALLSRKRVNDNSIPLQRAFDAEIELITV